MQASNLASRTFQHTSRFKRKPAASRERHANSNHKNDRSYDYKKAIVPIDHQAAVAAKRKKDNDHTRELTLRDENMEVDNSMNSLDNPST